jgi:hypothetical protein
MNYELRVMRMSFWEPALGTRVADDTTLLSNQGIG